MELKLSWSTERWSALPERGALLDQDYGLMYRMGILSNIFQTVLSLKNMKGHSIHNLTTGQRRLIKFLMDSDIAVMG